MSRAGRRARAVLAAALLSGCAGGVPIQQPAAVAEQARRSARIERGKTTREEVRAALGEPWLSSRAWGFDAFRATGKERELAWLWLPPLPIGVFSFEVGGHVLVTYDAAGVVEAAASGRFEDKESRGLMLRAGPLLLGIAAVEMPGPQLIADASALARYVAARRAASECTVVLACEPAGYERWPEEGCPDRVTIDGGASLDLRSFFAWCEGAECADLRPGSSGAGYVRVPLAVPQSLAPGRHELVLRSATFKGETHTPLSCAAGEVQFALVRGKVQWHWWSPSSSTLQTTVDLSERPPDALAAHRLLLHRGGRWLVEAEPQWTARAPE